MPHILPPFGSDQFKGNDGAADRMISMKFSGISKFACLAAVCLVLFAFDLIRAQNEEAPPSLIEPQSSATPQSSTDVPASPTPQTSTQARPPAAPQSSTETQSATVQKTAPASEDFGIGRFSKYPVHISASIQGGYDDNVLTSNGAHGSLFTSGNIQLGYQFGSPRTRLTLSTGAGLSYYFDRPGSRNYDENAFLDLSLSHKATPRLTLNAILHVAYQVEPDFSYNIGPDRRSGNYFYMQDKFAVAYMWAPRFSTLTSYTPIVVHYDSTSIGAINDRFENTFGNEFRFLLVPTTTLVAEYRYAIINYDTSPNDSTSHFALGGFDHTFNARLSFSGRGGVEFRSGDIGGNSADPYFESTLAYKFDKNTVNFTTRYSIEEPDVASYSARNTFRTGLELKTALTPRITSTASFYYQHSDYQQSNFGGVVSPAFTEQTFDLGFSLRYAITHIWGIQAGYDHTQDISDQFGREYSRNRYSGGLNLTF